MIYHNIILRIYHNVTYHNLKNNPLKPSTYAREFESPLAPHTNVLF